MVQGIVFDLDGLLIESEQDWDLVRREFVAEHGGTLTDENARAMLGMNTAQWSAYLREQFHLPLTDAEIGATVIERRMARYRAHMVGTLTERSACVTLGRESVSFAGNRCAVAPH